MPPRSSSSCWPWHHVANWNDNTVSVIDTATNSVTTTVTLPLSARRARDHRHLHDGPHHVRAQPRWHHRHRRPQSHADARHRRRWPIDEIERRHIDRRGDGDGVTRWRNEDPRRHAGGGWHPHVCHHHREQRHVDRDWRRRRPLGDLRIDPARHQPARHADGVDCDTGRPDILCPPQRSIGQQLRQPCMPRPPTSATPRST